MNDYSGDPVPKDWWEQLKAVEHQWNNPREIDYYDGETKMVRFCAICGAMAWEDWGEPREPQYRSCRIMTDWPGDDAPCICTRKMYLRAHGLMPLVKV